MSIPKLKNLFELLDLYDNWLAEFKVISVSLSFKRIENVENESSFFFSSSSEKLFFPLAHWCQFHIVSLVHSWTNFLSVLFTIFKKYFLNLFLEKGKVGRKRERNIDVREKHQSVASYKCPHWGSNLQPRHVPWPGTEPATSYIAGQCPINWATLARAVYYYSINPYCWLVYLIFTLTYQ